jgi:hypothetical protein
MYKWDHTAKALIKCGGKECFRFSLLDLPAWTNNDIVFDSSAGAELIRWSVNSEKWICRWISYYGQSNDMKFGSNQVLINWVDHQAIQTSHNPKIPNINTIDATTYCDKIMWGSTAGDLWVNGPIGRMEDTTGTWNTMPGIGVISRSMHRLPGFSYDMKITQSSVSVTFSDLAIHSAAIISASGQTMRRQICASTAALDISSLPAGMYLVQVDNDVCAGRMLIARKAQ